MNNLTVTNRMPSFERSMKSVFDDALKEAARDTLISAKTKAPFQKGGLRGDSDVKKASALMWRISFWKEYARFQEMGGDSKRKVRNYGTAGTGAHFLKESGDEQRDKLQATFKKHAKRAKA